MRDFDRERPDHDVASAHTEHEDRVGARSLTEDHEATGIGETGDGHASLFDGALPWARMAEAAESQSPETEEERDDDVDQDSERDEALAAPQVEQLDAKPGADADHTADEPQPTVAAPAAAPHETHDTPETHNTHDAHETSGGYHGGNALRTLSSTSSPNAPAAAQRTRRGMTGFGAGFYPYSWTDPRINHRRLDPKVRRLRAQHVRMIVPGCATSTGLLGLAGTDWQKKYVDDLTAALAANPQDPKLKKKLAAAQKSYRRDQLYVGSFINTLALAGKNTTINLTFTATVGNPYKVQVAAAILNFFVGQGYSKLQVTLENEPNGSDRSNNFRGRFHRGINTKNQRMADAAAKEYVDAYATLDAELKRLNVRDDVGVIGGDMLEHHKVQFMRSITKQGLNNFVDGYSVHMYFGHSTTLKESLRRLAQNRRMIARYAPGKVAQVTEFGRARFATKQEKRRDPNHKGITAVEKGVDAAFDQGLFMLTAANVGFTGIVKWDAFYGGRIRKGDQKGDPGKFYMIGGPGSGYATDATYRLMKMFTHATEPGWYVSAANNRGTEGAKTVFKSQEGDDGAILAMSRNGKDVKIRGLPRRNGQRILVTVWNGNGRGGLSTHVQPRGDKSVNVPRNGAVAITTKG